MKMTFSISISKKEVNMEKNFMIVDFAFGFVIALAKGMLLEMT